jgi:putative sigma-54 modulation protein
VAAVQIKISARHGHLDDATQQFIRDKAEKLLHFFDRITMIEVTVDFQKDLKWVEFNVQAEHAKDLVASATAQDVLGATDQVLHKLEQQVRRYKEKIQDHRRRLSTGEVAGTTPTAEEPGEE